MSDERYDEMIDRVRAVYNPPPETPRDRMWETISRRMHEPVADGDDGSGTGAVIDLTAARRQRGLARHAATWATAAAAALVVLGIGIGRLTAPSAGPGMSPGQIATAPGATGGAAPVDASERGALRVAADEHLGRTESLLTMVRADARDGALTPGTAAWARDLLAETRLLMDARSGDDREARRLLEDLELVLAQIVGIAELGSGDGSRARTELELTVRGLENGAVLPRIQAALPAAQAGA